METITLWFQLINRREGLVATHNNRRVQICWQWNCGICNLYLRRQLREFEGGRLEAQLTLHRTPDFWEVSEYYLAHLVSIPEREAGIDEGIGFDVAECNAILFETPDGVILVDPGSMGFDSPSPLKQLIANQDVRATVVSHGHLDHWSDLGKARSLAFMTKLAFQLASRHANLQRDLSMDRVLREAKMAIPGHPIILDKLGLQVGTFGLPHSIPETMGLVIRGKRQRAVCLGDFRFNGWAAKTKARTMACLQEVGREKVDLLSLTIFNAHIPGFTPSESLIIDGLTDILFRARGRVIITCFSSNISRIKRIVEIAQVLARPVAFCGSGMLNSRELLGINNSEEAIDSEKAVVFVTGCQAEEGSVLWRIANDENPAFELWPDDTLVFSSRVIPGNEEVVKRIIVSLRPQVERLVLNEKEVSFLGLEGLEIEECLTHISGHGNKEDLRLALEILKPERVLSLPQLSPQIEAFREIAEPLGIEILSETERVIEV